MVQIHSPRPSLLEQELTTNEGAEERLAPQREDGGSNPLVTDYYFPFQCLSLRRVLLHDGKLQTRYIRFNIEGVSRNLRSQADCVRRFVGSQSVNTSAFPITNPL